MDLFKEIYLVRGITICNSLLKREENDPFFKRIVTGDKKWIVYNNVKRKRTLFRQGESGQSTAKADIHEKKVMLSVRWDWKGIVFFELLPNNQTINTGVYCRQLDKLDAAIKQKRPELVNRKGVVFYHDNERPHTSLVTRQKFLQLGWHVLPDPPDLAPSDYHLIRSLQNSLNGINFHSVEGIKNHFL